MRKSSLSSRLDQRHQIAHIFQFANFRGGKLDFEGSLHRKHQPDMSDAIPAVYVLSRQLRSHRYGFVENVLKYFGQTGVNLGFLHTAGSFEITFLAARIPIHADARPSRIRETSPAQSPPRPKNQ